MQTATKTNKRSPSRNKPCSCGSGKKYKRCCGKDQEPKSNQPSAVLSPQVAGKVLKNEFRKQVDPFVDIPGAELVRRDQMVLLAKLECTFGMQDIDGGYFQNIIQAFTDLKHKIQKMQPSPERGPTLTDIEAQLVEFTKRAKTVGFTRTNFLNLCALRSVLDQEVELVNKSVPQEGDVTLENDKVIEQALVGSGTQSNPSNDDGHKKDGPIEESGGGNPDNDFQGTEDQVEQQAAGNVK